MEMTNPDSLKEQLMTTDPEFRELAREHGRYEARLSELSALTYPSDEEQLEEITLKKKKLAIAVSPTRKTVAGEGQTWVNSWGQ